MDGTSSTGHSQSLPLNAPAPSLRPGVDALAPTGFIGFCIHHPDDCRDEHPVTSPVVLNAARWRALAAVNSAINLAIRPDSDANIYHQQEYWDYPKDAAGDCEDFALLKKRQLEARGFPRASLLMTVVFDEKNSGHAVLTVVTNEGDLVLDNRRDEILTWSDTGYRFVKRQSAENPARWVRIDGTGADNTAPVAMTLPLRLDPEADTASK